VGAVVVLGGYGQLGRRCVQAIAGQGRAPVVIAGRNIQRAEALALRLEGRAAHAYADASNPRTLARAIEGASALVLCCGGELRGAIDLALEMRVPVLSPAPAPPSRAARERLAESAWKAQVPLVACAGALPGLPGVLCEVLVRRFPAIEELHVSATGRWTRSETAARDVLERAPRPARRRERLARWLPRHCALGGARLALHPGSSPDLDGFAQAHCVGRLSYLEPLPWRLGARLDRLLSRGPRPVFALAAEARVGTRVHPAGCRIELQAGDPLLPATSVIASLVGAALARELPAGLLTPREARSPALLLADLDKQGVRVIDT
jgi:hypothetical protein